ncbi:YbaB/EbfC family nucleoid-associated protein [Nocardia sp. CS682]|uniref:YbaB/EbfC family nucleoid-associated protein n=1 Tax=Nocardia sp. CS682 TaxID=1047172 RepID=UPI00142FC74A|nr:YbaB/EbfC family nucleoid-associated protein [Nocardia sp. CS682]
MDYLDQWNDEQRRAAAEWRSKNEALQHSLAQIAVRTASRNGELSATVDGHGNVTDLRLTPQALRLGEVQLRRLLLDAIQNAQSDARRQAAAAARPYTDDPANADAMTFIRKILDGDAPSL